MTAGKIDVLWITVSLVLYCLPILGVLTLRAEPKRSGWAIASDLAISMAGDLLILLLLARFVTLENAAFITRAAYLVAFIGLIPRRFSTIRSAFVHGDRAFGVVACLAVAFAVWIGAQLSVRCVIWDREWHIPLVSAMRSQHTPFWNVYEQHGQLYYHYAGNAVAAVVQALSFGHMHASVALSLTHDLVLGAIGLFLAGAISVVKLRRLVPVLGCITAVLFAGPATTLWEGAARPDDGYSLVNLLSLSFRPHVPFAYLWVLAFALAALVPLLSGGSERARSTRPLLFVMTSVLVMTDESSLMILGLFLGALWLCAPEILHEKRIHGALVLAGLVATILGTVWLLGGTLSASGVSQQFEWVAPSVPGYYKASVGLDTKAGLGIFFLDYLLPISVWVAGLLSVIAAPTRRVVVLFLGYSALVLVSLGILCTLRINGNSTESHRFVTALMVLSPVFGLLWWREVGRDLGVERTVAIAATISGIGTIFCVVSTVVWTRAAATAACAVSRVYWGEELFFKTDCVQRYGVRLGSVDRPAYVSPELWYDYAGCHPLRAAGPDGKNNNHRLVIGLPMLGRPGLAKLNSWLAANEELIAICPETPPPSDAVCLELSRKLHSCVNIGPNVKRCITTSAERAALLDSIKG